MYGGGAGHIPLVGQRKAALELGEEAGELKRYKNEAHEDFAIRNAP